MLRGIVNAFVYPDDRIPADQIDLVVHECARESGGGGPLVTLGPRGIARLRFEASQKDRNQWLSKFSREKMVRNEEAVKEAERGEERRNQAEMERLMGELLGDGDDSKLRQFPNRAGGNPRFARQSNQIDSLIRLQLQQSR